jgi:hypothetical protein
MQKGGFYNTLQILGPLTFLSVAANLPFLVLRLFSWLPALPTPQIFLFKRQYINDFAVNFQGWLEKEDYIRDWYHETDLQKEKKICTPEF